MTQPAVKERINKLED
ncbi:Protein of unknown function [Bacillus thuringiensis]|nr:Protein of unknown function [Bacillus thuringiensis]